MVFRILKERPPIMNVSCVNKHYMLDKCFVWLLCTFNSIMLANLICTMCERDMSFRVI